MNIANPATSRVSNILVKEDKYEYITSCNYVGEFKSYEMEDWHMSMFNNARKAKIPEYYGDMLVCLDKARPISSLEDGRNLIGSLTQLKITSQNMRNRSQTTQTLYSEKDMVVPVFICNPEMEKDISVDWTRANSPITEIQCKTVQRWWPKSIFKCLQKIGDITEEIKIETNKFIVYFNVSYAFTAEQKTLFDDIPDYTDIEKPEVKDAFNITESAQKGKSTVIEFPDKSNEKIMQEIIDRVINGPSRKTEQNTEEGKKPKVAESIKDKPKDALNKIFLDIEKEKMKKYQVSQNILFGIFMAILSGACIYFGVKYYHNNMEESK
jgi:hypothetical protein